MLCVCEKAWHTVIGRWCNYQLGINYQMPEMYRESYCKEIKVQVS